MMGNRKCFSLSGWWQTLCGLDAANQGFGWSSLPENVGCKDCRSRINKREHLRWGPQHILMEQRTLKPPGTIVKWHRMTAIVVDNQSHKLHKEHHKRGPNLTLIALAGSGELLWVHDDRLEVE
jgi:hypothetical protein